MLSGSKLLWGLLVLAAAAVAQTPTATVSGEVRDTQGALVIGATVTSINVNTGGRTVTKTNDSGVYSLRQLPIGQHTIEVELQGFRKSVQQNIMLSTGQS